MASVGKSRAPESGYQKCMTSHQPKAEMLERWGQLCATYKVCFKSGSKNYIIKKKSRTSKAHA